MKLFILDGGHLGPYDKSEFFYGHDFGVKIVLPVWQTYIEHPEARILIDTGIDPKTDNIFERAVHQKPEQGIERQLELIGVNPDQIDIVINTHLHYDHVSNNHLFENAVFIVQKDELRHAYVPEKFEWQFYQPKSNFDVEGLNYEVIEGDYEIVPDIHIIVTPGHSPGHQSVLVEGLNSGPILIAGDAVYLRESLEKFIIPYIVFDPTKCLASQKRVDFIAKQKEARVFASHDDAFFKTLKKAPDYYD
jgi:4-pyridoxolactonase